MGFLRARKRQHSATSGRGRTFTQRSPLRGERAPRNAPRLPHERDESVDARDPDQAGSSLSQRRIELASEDIRHGRVDTERRGLPSDVPGRPAEHEGERPTAPRRRPRGRLL